MKGFGRRLGLVGMLVAVILAGASTARAQIAAPKPAAPASGDGFTVGYTDFGPVIGLGAIDGADISVGGRFEHAFKELPNAGNGVLAFGASVDFYRYDLSPFGSFTYTPIGGFVNYHFRLQNTKIDPFAGVGLGNYVVTTPVNCTGCSYNSGVYLIAHGGVRYFYRPNLAFYADVGAYAGALHVGVMFKPKGR